MKKHLIAAAVAAAVAVPAMAQNVSIDGYIEMGYSSIDSGVGAKRSSINGAGDTFGGSVLNIRGTEDLGGGLSVGFRMTKEFTEDTGAQVSNGGEWTDVLLSISDKGLGTLQAGRFAGGTRDLGGVYRFNGDFGRPSSLTRTHGNRNAGHVQYSSPEVMGFSVRIMHGKVSTNDTATAGREQAGTLFYTSGPLRLAVSTGKRADYAAAQATSGNNNQKETAIGGSYDFGFMKVGFAQFKDDYDADNGTESFNADSTTNHLSFNAPLGGGINLFGSYNSYSSDAANADGKGFHIGISKDLSKRTKIFAVSDSVRNQENATWSYTGRTNGAASGADADQAAILGLDPKRLGLGITHSF